VLVRALCDALTDEGFEAAGLPDPALVPDALRGTDFDLLLSDRMTPGTDGIQLFRQTAADRVP
jgi:DNA-binding response OmpR family regulator